MKFNSLRDLVGNTPYFQIFKNNNLFNLKLEMFNPGLSIKDRVAFYVTEKLLTPETKSVIEYTSGNLGIGLCLASSVYGFDCILVTTSLTSKEKLEMLKSFGAKVVVINNTAVSNESDGMIGVARHLSQQLPNSLFINQFENELNAETHYNWTAKEIYEEYGGTVDYIFASMGTGGTISGIGRFFKENNPKTKIIGITPDCGIYYTEFYGMNPKSRPHSGHTFIEGVGEDFIPHNLQYQYIDEIVEVKDHDALASLNYFKREHGLFMGGSSGLAIAGAMDYMIRNKIENKNVVIICPDSGNRYLSTIHNNNFRHKIKTRDNVSIEGDLAKILNHIKKEEYPYVY